MINRIVFILFFCILIPNNKSSIRIESADPDKIGIENQSLIEEVQEESIILKLFDSFENDTDITVSSWSFYAYNITKNEHVVEKYIKKKLIPASVQKIVTTATAFDKLSGSYFFKTDIYYNGIITEDSTLNGDIIIYGSGDPTIDFEQFGRHSSAENIFEKWKNSILKTGIKKINGNIIGDASLFGYMLPSPSYLWEDIGNYYGAGASGLTFRENKFKITFNAGNTGDKATILKIDSLNYDIEFINLVTIAEKNTGDNVHIFNLPFQKNILLLGTIPAGKSEFSVFAADPNPALSFSSEFYKFLNENALNVEGKPTYIYDQQKSPIANKENINKIATHQSPSLQHICEQINKKSHNVTAECLYRTLGVSLNNDASYAQTSNAIARYWEGKDLPVKNLSISDGSGLSRKNLLSTEFLVKLLIYIYEQDYFESFYETLAIAGVDGTLENFGRNTIAEKNIRAKSGYMGSIRSYAGYFTTQSGDVVAFAVIVNFHDGSAASVRKKIEQLLITIIENA